MERAELQLSGTSNFFEIHKKIREKFEKIWNIFEKIMIFQKNRNFRKFLRFILHTKSYWKSKFLKFQNFRKFRFFHFFWKIMIFSKFFIFFPISRLFFYGCQKILMFWKAEAQLFPISIMFIYEICFPRSLFIVFLKNHLNLLIL